MTPKKVKLTTKTDAELALEKRYELLRKKKEEKAAKKAAANAVTSKQGGAPSNTTGLPKSSNDAAEASLQKVSAAAALKPVVAKFQGHHNGTSSGGAMQIANTAGLSKPSGTSKLVLGKDSRLAGASVSTSQSFAKDVITPQPQAGGTSLVTTASASEPLSAFERTKMILAKEAERKRPGSKTIGMQSKALPREPWEMQSATGSVSLEKDPASIAREKAVALLKSKTQKASTTTEIGGSDAGCSNTHGAPGRVDAHGRKTPNLKRPAARTNDAVSTKRTRCYEVGGVDTGVAGDEFRAVNGTLERESKDGREVFVGDLPDNCTIEAVASALYRFGNVNSVRVMEARNFGFVTFADREAAARAVEACRSCRVEVRGRIITVDYARGAVPGWKHGDSKDDTEESAPEHKYLAEIRSKAVEEYKKISSEECADGRKEYSSTAGDNYGRAVSTRHSNQEGSSRDLVVYDDI